MQDSSTTPGAAIPNFEAQLDAMVARGLDVYRMDISWMQWMPTAKGVVDTAYKARFDNCLRELKERNFKRIILTAIETPEWARPAHTGGANKFWRPANMVDYADFWTYFCTVYKADAALLTLEIWNEPSQVAFWQSRGTLTQKQTATEYAEMLVRSYNAIKAVDSKFEVGGFVLHRAHDSYAQDVFDARTDTGNWDVRGKFDIFDVHLYVSTVGSGAEGPYARQNDRSHAFKPGLDLMQEVLIRNGIGTQVSPFPIMVTEYGWSDATINAANGDSPAHNEATTANRDTWTRDAVDILFKTPYRNYVKYATIYTVALHPSIEGETMFNGSYVSPLPVFDSYANQLAANGGSGAGGNVTFHDPPEAAAVTVANTTVETVIYESTLSIGELKSRTAFRLFLQGRYSTSAVAALFTLKVYVNDMVTPIFSRASTSAANKANVSMFTWFLMTLRRAGSAGKYWPAIWGMWDRTATDVVYTGAEKDIDTTAPVTVRVTVTWGAAAAGNTITIDQAFIEPIR